MRFWFLPLILGAALLVRAAEEVPIYEREPPTDPEELKKYYEELGKAVKAAENATKGAAAKDIEAALAPTASHAQPAEVAIPRRDNARIKIASSRVLTEKTIAADLAGLVKQLRDGLDEESVAEADAFLKVYGGDPSALADAAAMAWVQEAPGTALLLAAEGAQRSPGNTNALNTLGALLSDAGYVERGIPILNYLATKFPNDPTLQNNLGQAWLGVGAPELAKPRLLACLALAPAHGAANAAMGVITYCAGDQAAATKHFQAAAVSNSSPVARRALDLIDAPYDIPRSFRRLAPVQEYFNPRQFVPPVGQTSLQDAETKKAEIAEFTRLVKERMSGAETKIAEAGGRMPKDAAGMATLAFRQSIAPALGVSRLDFKHIAGAFEDQAKRGVEFQRDVDQFLSDSGRMWADAEINVAKIRADFAARWKLAAERKEIGEGAPQNEVFIAASKQLCADCRKVMEDTLPTIADRYNDLVTQVSTRERVAINEELTYLPLMIGGDLHRQQFYSLVMGYLQRVGYLGGICPVHTYECGPIFPADLVNPAIGDLPSPGGCPLKINFKCRVGKLKLDCTSIGFEVEAGLKFGAKKDFKSGETTLTGGLGVDMGLSKVGQVEGSAQFVVVWDRGNNLGFVGVQSSASASLGGIPGLSGSVDTGEGASVGGSTRGVTPDLVNVSSATKLGVTLGPRGVEPTLTGHSGVEVLGQDLVKAEL
jgi:hypothetical protein